MRSEHEPEPEPEPEPEEPRTFAVWLEGNSETAGLDAQLRIHDDGVTLTDPSGSNLVMKLPWRALSEWQAKAEELRILVVDGKTRKTVVVKTPRCEEVHDRMLETAQKLAAQMVHDRKKKKLQAVGSTPAEGVPPTPDQGVDEEEEEDGEEEEEEEHDDDDDDEEEHDNEDDDQEQKFQRRVEQERERQRRA